ncbi:MAG: DUF4149 domain-containing protein [Gemmatimonadaceae bacterium]|nr:DUF4149 domain-containing protein [Gemmatimonadaceae bacterium]
MTTPRLRAGHAAAPLALAMWLGAAVLVAAVVAPAAFRVLPTRTLAGALVGQVLPVLFIAGIAVGVLAHILDTLAGKRASWVARVGGAALVLGCAGAQFGVGARIEALRRDLPAPIETLAPTDPQRQAFGRLHGISVLLLGVAGLGAAATMLASIRAERRG